MNIRQHSLGMALLMTLVMSHNAFAQALQPAPATPSGTPSAAPGTSADMPPNMQWSATAMVSALTGSDLYGGAPGFGADLTYLHRDWLGAEATINFAPGVDLATPADDNSSIATYFVNALVRPRIEARGVRPFLSAGLGLIHKAGSAGFLGEPVDFSDNQFGLNVGVGVTYFRGPWGLRSDFRHYMAVGEEGDDLEVEDPNDILGNTAFWRWDFGVSYRWE